MKKFFVLAALVVCLGAGWYFFTRADTEPSNKPVQQTDSKQTAPALSDSQPALFDKARYSVDDPVSIWVVANKQRPLNPKEYVPNDLTSIGSVQLRQEAAQALTKLRQAASAQGLTITPLSGYRSYTTQVTVYNREVSHYGQATADTQSARPGHSEHQSGLAVDVGGGGCGIEDCFGNTPEGKWLAANAHTYGYVIRYPEGKQDITGYRYEPWHIRYVGLELASEMKKQGALTLEEFFGLPAAATY